ncbi:hypothetical protein F5883DRAFT_592355 [Diaporthe sp. PMI_573]|nr:hypothetical protein F5883DRAFT_592355 [Diaporthaceae sp. PMI_573]
MQPGHLLPRKGGPTQARCRLRRHAGRRDRSLLRMPRMVVMLQQHQKGGEQMKGTLSGRVEAAEQNRVLPVYHRPSPPLLGGAAHAAPRLLLLLPLLSRRYRHHRYYLPPVSLAHGAVNLQARLLICSSSGTAARSAYRKKRAARRPSRQQLLTPPQQPTSRGSSLPTPWPRLIILPTLPLAGRLSPTPRSGPGPNPRPGIRRSRHWGQEIGSASLSARSRQRSLSSPDRAL